MLNTLELSSKNAHKKRMKKLSLILVAALSVQMLCACADKYGVPGGDDKVNEHIFKDKQGLMDAIGPLQPGMSREHTFSVLNVEEKDLVKLNREEIITALFGDNRVSLDDMGAHDAEQMKWFLRSLTGYRLDYADVEREHGFKNPIRLKTIEEGFRYGIVLVYQNNVLLEKPILTGGAVKRSSSRTIFDYLSPSMLFGGL